MKTLKEIREVLSTNNEYVHYAIDTITDYFYKMRQESGIDYIEMSYETLNISQDRKSLFKIIENELRRLGFYVQHRHEHYLKNGDFIRVYLDKPGFIERIF